MGGVCIMMYNSEVLGVLKEEDMLLGCALICDKKDSNDFMFSEY